MFARHDRIGENACTTNVSHILGCVVEVTGAFRRIELTFVGTKIVGVGRDGERGRKP